MTGFSPRSHEGSDTPKTTMTAITISFNPRSHEGSDFLFGMMQGKLSVFQSTLPRGERHIYFQNKSGFFCFNPRSHEGSDLLQTVRLRTAIRFNPRSHEGSDVGLYEAVCKLLVSIHAPTRGATINVKRSLNTFGSFNPRSHEGSDINRIPDADLILRVSIHAPTRGATTAEQALWGLRKVSIHAPTRGATYNSSHLQVYYMGFNPRSHEGSDHSRTGIMGT